MDDIIDLALDTYNATKNCPLVERSKFKRIEVISESEANIYCDFLLSGSIHSITIEGEVKADE